MKPSLELFGLLSGLFSKSGTHVRGMTMFDIKKYKEITGIVAYACTPSTWEVEIGKFGLQGRALLHGSLRIDWVKWRHCLKTPKKYTGSNSCVATC